MQIRPAEREDALQVAEIGKKAFIAAFLNAGNREEVLEYLDKVYDLDYLEERMSSTSNRFLVIEKEASIIGFAELNFEVPEALKGSVCLKLERLYLNPEAIGTGAGAALMKASIEFALKEKSDVLWLQVLCSNARAMRFYESWGFSEFHRSPGKFKADREVDLWMKIQLSS